MQHGYTARFLDKLVTPLSVTASYLCGRSLPCCLPWLRLSSKVASFCWHRIAAEQHGTKPPSRTVIFVPPSLIKRLATLQFYGRSGCLTAQTPKRREASRPPPAA